MNLTALRLCLAAVAIFDFKYMFDHLHMFTAAFPVQLSISRYSNKIEYMENGDSPPI